MSPSDRDATVARTHGLVLSILLGLFIVRVIAQLLQAFAPVSFLPRFDVWHSGTLPYSILVLFQLLIVMGCLRVVRGFFSGTVEPSRRKARILLALGWLYLLTMGARLFIGLTLAPDHPWFGAVLPTVFHLVLGAFVLVYGHFHSVAEARLSLAAEQGPA